MNMIMIMETQGHRKNKQILSDLQKNNLSKERLHKIKQEKDPKKVRGLELKFCKDYGIDYGDLKHLLNDQNATDWTASIDMCAVGFAYPDDPLIKKFFPSAARTKKEVELHKAAYPVSIDLHKFCTKNDLRNFIDMHWTDLIEKNLIPYRGKNRKIIRLRPKEESNDFIFQQREQGKTTKEIKGLLKDNFNLKMMPEEIEAVLSHEKKSRNKNLVTST